MGVVITHKTFVIERELPGSRNHAFRFWSQLDLKRRWTNCHPDWTVLEDRLDFRRGGAEVMRWRMEDGIEYAFEAHYLDIVPAERIIYAYAMSAAGVPASSALATVEFEGAGVVTRMIYTEQAAFTVATDGRARQAGTETGFELLAAVMEQDLAGAH